MASEALAARDSAVPDLARTPALTITAEDVSVPRIYVGQFMSKAVQAKLVSGGDIYAAQAADDPDPVRLWEFGSEDPGVVFYVLGLRKGKSINEGGELTLFDYNDPSAPENADVTYDYTVLIPSLDEEIPAKFLLSRSGRQSALKMNTVIKKNSINLPAWALAFRLTSIAKENAKGKFWVASVSQVDADQEHVKLAGELASQISTYPQQSAAFGSNGEAPSL